MIVEPYKECSDCQKWPECHGEHEKSANFDNGDDDVPHCLQKGNDAVPHCHEKACYPLPYADEEVRNGLHNAHKPRRHCGPDPLKPLDDIAPVLDCHDDASDRDGDDDAD